MPNNYLKYGSKKLCQSYVVAEIVPFSVPTSCGTFIPFTVLIETALHKSAKVEVECADRPTSASGNQSTNQEQIL